MLINSKRYMRLFVVTALVIVVGFWIDDEYWPAGVAIALFWLVVTVFYEIVRSRKSKREIPDIG